jgi:transcriptional regulator with XRE-family HTH domain
MKEHFCPIEQSVITYQGQCNWCGENERQHVLRANLDGMVAVAIRSARTAVGWNQQEFAGLMGVAKTTVARIETMEMKAPAQFLLRAVYLFKTRGIGLDMHGYDELVIRINNQAINNAVSLLADITNRRSDKKVKELNT